MFHFDNRHLHPIFHFHSYQWKFEAPNKLLISYDFEIEKLVCFKPAIEIKFPNDFKNSLTPENICQLVFQYGLVEMISYWKSTCSPLIMIHCGKLNSSQISFWKNLYYHGLGEFRFKNKIMANENEFLNIEFDDHELAEDLFLDNKIYPQLLMVPIGGGKDSIVTLEIMCKNKLKPLLFFLNPRESTFKIADASGIPKDNWIIANRQIDKNLLLLNDQGYLNGHTPFSALLAFLTILVGVPLGVNQIILSNENSANEGNAEFNGEIINHQYSKTFDFEKKFDSYRKQYLTHQTNYFSFLRPLKELQIAKLFSKYTKYHTLFRSCNVGQKQDYWCCQCSKCLFVWVILSPWISFSGMEKIFGKNLWNDNQLLQTLKELAGINGNKPFECVGTIAEVRSALVLSAKKYTKQNFSLLKEVQKWDLKISMDTINQNNLVPQLFMEMLNNELSS